MGTRNEAATPAAATGDMHAPDAAAAAAGGAGDVGSERDCGATVAAAEETVRMGDSPGPREAAATVAATAASPAGANEPGVGGALSMHCGLTGRVLQWLSPGSAPLGRPERKGPGLMGRSLATVRLDAACEGGWEG